MLVKTFYTWNISHYTNSAESFARLGNPTTPTTHRSTLISTVRQSLWQIDKMGNHHRSNTLACNLHCIFLVSEVRWNIPFLFHLQHVFFFQVGHPIPSLGIAYTRYKSHMIEANSNHHRSITHRNLHCIGSQLGWNPCWTAGSVFPILDIERSESGREQAPGSSCSQWLQLAVVAYAF